jgi:hypothetical protein
VSEDRTSEGKSAPAFDSSFGQMIFLTAHQRRLRKSYTIYIDLEKMFIIYKNPTSFSFFEMMASCTQHINTSKYIRTILQRNFLDEEGSLSSFRVALPSV